jgi:hypothetical protein
MVMSPTGLETKNNCAGEGQQQFSSQQSELTVGGASVLVSLESAVRQVSCEGERILRCWKTATSEDCEV